MTEPIEAKFTVRLPRSMSEEEYKLFKRGFVEEAVWARLFEQFHGDGKILWRSYCFLSDRSVTSLIFKSPDELSEWQKETRRLRTHNFDLIARAGCVISREFSPPGIQTLLRRQSLPCEQLETVRRYIGDGHMVAVIKEACHSDADAVDVGSHTGRYTWFMAAKASRVFSVDPTGPVLSHESADIVREAGIDCSRLKEKIFHTCSAAGDVPGSATYYQFENDAFNSILPRDHWNHHHACVGQQEVQVTTLDETLASARASFIKIDAEGMDFRVVLGARNVIARDRPVVVMECNAKHLREHLPDIIEWFKRLGYGTWPLEASRRALEDTEISSAEARRFLFVNLLAAPLEHPRLDRILSRLNEYDEFCAQSLKKWIADRSQAATDDFLREARDWMIQTWRS